jgi:hypothetical protein
MKTFTFTLDAQQAQMLINIVGSLPTHSGAYPLFELLKAQAESQLQDNQGEGHDTH